MRAEFERVGGGQVLNNSPYDLAAPWLCLREAGGVVSDGWGEPLDRRRLLGSGHEFQMSSISRLERAAARATGTRGGPGSRSGSAPSTPEVSGERGSISSGRSVPRLAMLQPVSVPHKHLNDYASIVGRPLADEIRERAERLEGKRVLHVSATSFGGGVSEILYTLVPLMIDVGLAGRVARDLRARGVLQRDQGHAQRAPGQPAGPERGPVEDVAGLQRDQRARAVRRMGRVHRARPPAGGACRRSCREKSRRWVWRCHIDLSTPNPDTLARLLPYLDPYPAAVFHMQQVRAGGHGRPRAHHPAGDRSAGAEEHGVLARGRRVHLRAVRDRRRPAAAVPGVALRSVEGSARGDRRLPDRQGSRCRTCSSRWSARWPPTTPRGGTTSTRPSRTPRAIPTFTS